MKPAEVILIRDVPGLGSAGEIKRVRAGYARNYLIPKGLALPATPQNLKAWEEAQRVRRAREARAVARAQELARKLRHLKLRFSLMVGEEGKAFGSITAADITRRLSEAGYPVEKGQVLLESPIKTTGEHRVTVRLHPEVSVELKVLVEAE